MFFDCISIVFERGGQKITVSRDTCSQFTPQNGKSSLFLIVTESTGALFSSVKKVVSHARATLTTQIEEVRSGVKQI
tara:strand:+ start:45250 stop:45480 length:231 start_codon:yes stop_codon:yes gene_type:complete